MGEEVVVALQIYTICFILTHQHFLYIILKNFFFTFLIQRQFLSVNLHPSMYKKYEIERFQKYDMQ